MKVYAASLVSYPYGEIKGRIFQRLRDMGCIFVQERIRRIGVLCHSYSVMFNWKSSIWTPACDVLPHCEIVCQGNNPDCGRTARRRTANMVLNVYVKEVENDHPVGLRQEAHQLQRFSFKNGRKFHLKTNYCSTCPAHNFAVCARLKENTLAQFGQDNQVKTFKAGQTMFCEQDDVNYFYSVISGDVRLTRLLEDGRRQIIGFKSVGDLLGLSMSGHHTTNAEALGDVTVCQISTTKLYAEMESNSAINARLMEMTQSEMIRLQDKMLLLGRKSPIEKIASFLCERVAQKMRYEGSSNENRSLEITLPMSRVDIADYLGLTIETVSRNFTKLRKLAVIDLKTSQTILIADLYQLQVLADIVD